MGKKRELRQKILNMIGVLLCVLLFPFAAINLTLVVQSIIFPNIPPNFLGYTPFVVDADSMLPTFGKGDLLLIKNVSSDEAATLPAGTIICFRTGEVYVTHRIKERVEIEGNKILYITQGDANESPDARRISTDQLLGIYAASFSGVGGFLLFIQTPVGMTFSVFLPILIIVLIFYSKQRGKGQTSDKETEDIKKPF